ncbi:MAG: tetratricopeptide repeat protein [bacterium]|nr:tetratricopeptide repeat protein [bacterium]
MRVQSPPPHRMARRWFWVAVLAAGAGAFALIAALGWIAQYQQNQTPQAQIESLRRTGRPVQALYLVESSALVQGWTAERLRLAGDLWREIGDPAAAAAYWQRALSAAPDDVRLLRDLAETYIGLGQWTQAAAVLAQYTALEPAQPWAAFQLGLIRAAVDADALTWLETAGTEPAYAPIVTPLVTVLREPALEAAERALRLGIALAEQAQWPYAELAFSQAVGDPERAALALAYNGWARDMQGKDGSADIRRAVALAPDDARVRYLEGLHYRTIGDDASSILAFERAVALDPASPGTYAQLGAAYALTGDRAAAQYWLETALAVSNDDPRYQVLLNRFYAEERDLLTALGFDSQAFLQAESTPEATAEATSDLSP